MREKPLFTHDCEKCTFLGVFDGRDLYHHESPISLIARFGNEPWDYESGIALVNIMPHITEAHKRAGDLGLNLKENYSYLKGK